MSKIMEQALGLITASNLKQGLPVFRVGQTVRVHQRIVEGNKERLQVFEGIIIKKNSGSGINSTITVRKVVDGVGVERVYALHSPNIAKIEITKEAKIRRSKLYYMRDLTGKAARLRTTLLEGQVYTGQASSVEEAAAEEVSGKPDANKVEEIGTTEAPEVKNDDQSEERNPTEESQPPAEDKPAEPEVEAPAEPKSEEQ